MDQLKLVYKTVEEILRSYVNLSHNDRDVSSDSVEYVITKQKSASMILSALSMIMKLYHHQSEYCKMLSYFLPRPKTRSHDCAELTQS